MRMELRGQVTAKDTRLEILQARYHDTMESKELKELLVAAQPQAGGMGFGKLPQWAASPPFCHLLSLGNSGMLLCRVVFAQHQLL